MSEILHKATRILRAPLGAQIDGMEITLDAKQKAWEARLRHVEALRETYDDASTTGGMREWITAEMTMLRDPGLAHIMRVDHAEASGGNVWSAVPFFPSAVDEESLEGLAAQREGLPGWALVERLFGGWSGKIDVVHNQGRGDEPSATYFDVTLSGPLARKFVERFCTPPARERVAAEIDDAMRAIELAVAGGAMNSMTPVRERGLSILQFHPASADKLARHVELLAHLRSRGLLNDLELSKVTLAPGAEHSGLIVAAGPSRSIADLGAVYRHPDAEAFVTQRCEDDWSLVSPTATVSDTSDGANGINLPMTEVRFEELLKAVRRAQSVEPIG